MPRRRDSESEPEHEADATPFDSPFSHLQADLRWLGAILSEILSAVPLPREESPNRLARLNLRRAEQTPKAMLSALRSLFDRLGLTHRHFLIALTAVGAAVDPEIGVKLQEMQREPIGGGLRAHLFSRILADGGQVTPELLQDLAPTGVLRLLGLLVSNDAPTTPVAFERFTASRALVAFALGVESSSQQVAGGHQIIAPSDGDLLDDPAVLLQASQVLDDDDESHCVALQVHDREEIQAILRRLAHLRRAPVVLYRPEGAHGTAVAAPAGPHALSAQRLALRDALLTNAVLAVDLTLPISGGGSGSLEPQGDSYAVSSGGRAGNSAAEDLRRLVEQAQHARVPVLFLYRGGAGAAELPIAPAADLKPALPGRDSRLRLWRRALVEHDLQAERRTIERAAALFELSSGAIVRTVKAIAASREQDVHPSKLAHAVTQMALGGSPSLGQIVEPDRDLSLRDLHAAPELLEELVDLIGRCRFRLELAQEPSLRKLVSGSAVGVVALFSGPPGTGKTLAARILAAELGIGLVRIDLSRVVSKWLGETEKNLGAILDAAESGCFAVLFDEADALFGKRTSDTKSSNDRYANLEVNFLLQRLERFRGIALLTSNLEGAIDEAFRRRLAARIPFPVPDQETREQLWRSMVPGSLRLSRQQLHSLGEHEVSGGVIRNAVLRAASRAMAASRPLQPRDLTLALYHEQRANGRLVLQPTG